MSKRSNNHSSSIAASSRSSSIDFPSDLKHKTLGKDIDKIIKHFHKEDTTKNSSSLSFSSNYIPNLKHWKELGSYLESLQIVQPKDSSSNSDSKNKNKLNTNNNNSKNSTDSSDSDSFENLENISNNLINSKNPLSAPLVYRICNHCDRPILETALAEHIKSCIDMKNSKKALAAAATAAATPSSAKDKPKNTRKRKNQDVDSKESTPVLNSPTKVSSSSSSAASSKISSSPTKNSTTNTPKTSATPSGSAAANSTTAATTPATSASATTSASTATADSKQPPNKKQKKMPKEKKPKKEKAKPAPKVKGPVDVEKQCGVPLPNGGFCARSLTCKTHSMGAKRAVPGRSAPYDQLLAAYQRKNQAKIAAGAAAAQQAKEDLVHGAAQPLDDDEETHQVLEGVMRSAAYPLERKVFMPTNLRNSFLRMREMFAGAVLPKTTENPFGALQGRAAVMNINKSTDYYFPVRTVPKPVKPVVPNNNQQKPAGSPGAIQAGSPTQTPTPAQLVARQQQQRQPQQASPPALQQQHSYQVPQNQQITPSQAQQMRLNNMTPQQRQAFLAQQQQQQQQMMPNTNSMNNNNNNNMYNLSSQQNSQLNNAALQSKEAVVLQAQKLKQVQQQKQMMMMNTQNMP